jgi:hypothetical protein
VLDEENGRGIERAEVRLIRGAIDLGRPTDGFGYFAFPNVQEGVYELLVRHIAYGTRRDSIEIVGGQLYDSSRSSSRSCAGRSRPGCGASTNGPITGRGATSPGTRSSGGNRFASPISSPRSPACPS